MIKKHANQIGAFLALFWLPLGVSAHSSGIESGFVHPVAGLDHLLAMLAVGVWSTKLGAPRWVFPAVFLFGMNASSYVSATGMFTLPYIESGILVSIFALSILIAAKTRHSIWTALSCVMVFALFHGTAHGLELPLASSLLEYQSGFSVTCLLLILLGQRLPLLVSKLDRPRITERRYHYLAFLLAALGLVVAV